MKIYSDYSLKELNTFGLTATAGHFAAFSSVSELAELLEDTRFREPGLILGGGSNILLTHNPSSVLKNEIKGIEKINEDTDYVYVRAGAGESWHGFVQHCLNHGWAGVENLSLIPGKVGASPMQNIGAYGVEIKDVFHSLEAFHLKAQTLVTFDAGDCHFGYRDSTFKNERKGEFAILTVTFRLTKQPHFQTAYGAIERELEAMGVTSLSIRAISEAVIRIRSAKLPDPSRVGNAGSFFKNPMVTAAQKALMDKDFPELPAYPFNGGYKLAAGWLIEQCGWKGYRQGDAGVHPRQALVLVNYGEASGADIVGLSESIQQSVQDKFGIRLEREVNLV